MNRLFETLLDNVELRKLSGYWVFLVIMIGVGLLAYAANDLGLFGKTFAGLAGLASIAGVLVLFAVDSGDSGDDEDEEDEAARTIVAMPLWMIEQAEKKEAEAAKAKESEEEPAQEESAPPQVGEASALASDVDAWQEEPTDEVDLGTAQTMMFDPADAVRTAEAVQKEREALEPVQLPADAPSEPEPSEVEPLAGTGTAQFAAATGDLAPPAPQADVPDEDEEEAATSAQTMAYSPQELEKLRGQLGQAIAQQAGEARQDAPDTAEVSATEDTADDEALKTMMYMPAMGATPQTPEPAPEPEHEEALAPTQAFMPAVSDEEAMGTMVFDRDAQQKITDAADAATAQSGTEDSEVETGGQTQMYSLEDSDKLKEAYELLQQKKDVEQTGPEETAPAPAQPSSKPAPQPVASAPAKPREAPVSSSGIDYDADDVKKGMGAGTAILLFVILLAAAGVATAVILHYFNVVELPFNLPTVE